MKNKQLVGFLLTAMFGAGVLLVPMSASAAIPYAYKRIASLSGNTTVTASSSVKPGAGALVELTCTNAAATGRYIQVFNSIAAVVGTTAPLLVYPISAKGTDSVGLTILYNPPRQLGGTRIVLAATTTAEGAATASDGDVNCYVVYQ